MQGAGCRVQGHGAGCMVQGVGCRVQGHLVHRHVGDGEEANLQVGADLQAHLGWSQLRA